MKKNVENLILFSGLILLYVEKRVSTVSRKTSSSRPYIRENGPEHEDGWGELLHLGESEGNGVLRDHLLQHRQLLQHLDAGLDQGGALRIIPEQRKM